MLASRSLLLRRHSRQTVWAMSSLARQKHTLPDLPYGYKALEPTISGEIMELHHSKHHATYVNNLNAAEEQLRKSLENGKIAKVMQAYQFYAEQFLKCALTIITTCPPGLVLSRESLSLSLSLSLPPPLSFSEDVSGVIAGQSAIKFNGGGHINHSIFWKNLSPDGGGLPEGIKLVYYTHLEHLECQSYYPDFRRIHYTFVPVYIH